MDAGNTLISFFRTSVFSLVCVCLTQSLTVNNLPNSLTIVFKFISPTFLVPEDFYKSDFITEHNFVMIPCLNSFCLESKLIRF